MCPYCAASIGNSYLYGSACGRVSNFVCGPDTPAAVGHDLAQLAQDTARRAPRRATAGCAPPEESHVPCRFVGHQTIALPPATYDRLETALQHPPAATHRGRGDTLWTHIQPFPDGYAVHLQVVHAAAAPYLAMVLVDHKGRAVEWADPAYTLAGLTTMIATTSRGAYQHTVEIVRGGVAHPSKDTPSRTPKPDPPSAASHSWSAGGDPPAGAPSGCP